MKRRGDIAENELSADARAILEYARHWGTPFTRREIVEVAPGADWSGAPFPRTVAKLDPIRELITARMIELAEERRSSGGPHGGHLYRVYRLTERTRVLSLADLLEMLIGATSASDERLEEIRAEILDRFGRPPR